MKRVASESRQPGAVSHRRCIDCDAPLAVNDDCSDRCVDCRPRLSEHARAIGEERRRALDQFKEGVRGIKQLEVLINRLNRRLT
jgi:hypothetical protein